MSKNRFFQLNWEWEEEVYNKDTDEYEMASRYSEVEIVFYFGEESFVEIEVVYGDELTDAEKDCIINYADSYLMN